MRLRDKIGVFTTMVYGKKWVKIDLRGKSELVPSFEDHFRIICALVHCEKEKYAHLSRPPAEMLRRFFSDCVDVANGLPMVPTIEDIDAAWDGLSLKFHMPERTRRKNVRPNP